MVVELKRCIVVLVMMAIASALVCSCCMAAGGDELVSISLKDVDVQSAIQALFNGTGRMVAVDSQVTGFIPIFSVKDTPFDVALKTLVKTAGLVYRVDNGVYLISKKPENSEMNRPPDAGVTSVPQVDTTTTAESIIDKVPLSNTGASELLNMMNGNINNNSSGYGSMGGMFGMNGMSSMNGMNGMNGMSSMNGMSGMGGYGSGYGSSYGARSW